MLNIGSKMRSWRAHYHHSSAHFLIGGAVWLCFSSGRQGGSTSEDGRWKSRLFVQMRVLGNCCFCALTYLCPSSCRASPLPTALAGSGGLAASLKSSQVYTPQYSKSTRQKIKCARAAGAGELPELLRTKVQLGRGNHLPTARCAWSLY
jgi:hypothetical protein